MFQAITRPIKGWRTVIIARMYAAASFAVAAHDYLLPYIAGTDWTPITQRFPAWTLPVFILLTGLAFDYLRHITDTKIGEKE